MFIGQLRELVPELFQCPGTVLYVGAREAGMYCLPELKAVGHEISVLEIWPVNVEALRGQQDIDYLICGDVREIDTLELPHSTYDVVFWTHGPEHVAEVDLPNVFAELERLSTFLVVLSCPWGVYEQGAIWGNPHEVHLSHLYRRHFEEMGYETVTLGQKDVIGSNLLAWKFVRRRDEVPSGHGDPGGREGLS